MIEFLFPLLGLSVSASVYCRFIEPFWLEVNEETISFKNKALSSRIRLLHLSDFHASSVVPFRLIDSAIERGLSYRPNLICLTGDFITRNVPDHSRYKKVLSALSSQAPTFACLGNHDGGLWVQSHGGYRDTSRVEQLLEESGIKCLLNTSETVTIDNQPLRLVGLGDLWAETMVPHTAFVQNAATDGAPIILLSHNPDTKDLLGEFQWDLMLSGHTHGGQIRIPLFGTPFTPVQDARYMQGLHDFNGRWIHVSKGVGSVFGVRLNCRPQVSILNLT
jgi:hypothetical protein